MDDKTSPALLATQSVGRICSRKSMSPGYRPHKCPDTKEIIESLNTDLVIIPGNSYFFPVNIKNLNFIQVDALH